MDKNLLENIAKQYSSGELVGAKKDLAEELGRRGLIDIQVDAPSYVEYDPLRAGMRGLYSGAVELASLPVTAMESLLKLGNVGLEAIGAPEQVRIPVSEQGLSGLLRGKGEELGYTYTDLSKIAPAARPAAVAGEVVGSSILPATAPVAIARTVPATGRVAATAADLAGDVGTLRQIGRQIVESAAQRPGAFLATEAGLAGLSAGGGALAEAVAPGDVTARVVGEIAPAISPVILFSRTVPALADNIRNVIGIANPKARAAQKIQDIAIKMGEDPEVLARNLLETPANEIDTLTAAQMTDSKALTALENTLIKESSVAGKAYELRAKETAETMNNLYRQVLEDGDPSKVFLAAQERKDYLSRLLENRVARADQKSRKLLGPIESIRPESEISVEARNIIEDALLDARKTESSLWGAIPQNIDVVPTNLASNLRKYKSEILDERMLPSPTEAFARRVANVVEQDVDQSLINQVFSEFDLGDVMPNIDRVTTGDLLDFRKVALRKARQLRSGANPDYDMARIMQGLADSALDDLSVLPGNQVDIARDFSRQLNAQFSKTFAADILGLSSRGRVRVEPELTLRKTMARGGPASEVQARQLEEAVSPIKGMSVADTVARPEQMRSAQQDFLMSMASATKNSRTQDFDANRLSKFISDNSGNIERLGLTDMFKNMQSARKAFETAQNVQRSASVNFDKKKIAARILKVGEEGINKFVANVINNSNNKQKELNDMFKLVASNKDALKGLRTAIFENIIDNGIDSVSGVLTGTKIKSYLNNTFAGDYTLRQALTRSGALTDAQMRRIDVIANQADRFSNAIKSVDNADEFLKKESYLFNMFTRLLGSRIGATSPMAKGTGATLVFASEGRKTAEKIFSILPKMRVNDVLTEAAISNPKLMAELLSRSTSFNRRAANRQQIEAYLIQAGIIDKESEE